MIKYPISFHTEASGPSGIQTPWKIQSQDLKGLCSIPPEFEGPGGALSPEDLFCQALTSCFIATFKVYAEKSKLRFENLQVRAELIADLDESQKPVMKSCLLHVLIQGSEKPDRIRTLAEKAFQSGFILRSVKTEVTLSLDVTG